MARLTPEARAARLAEMIAVVDEAYRAPRQEGGLEKLIGRLCAEFGARHRYQCGTFMLRMGGVQGTSTMGSWMVIQSWLRAARKKQAAP